MTQVIYRGRNGRGAPLAGQLYQRGLLTGARSQQHAVEVAGAVPDSEMAQSPGAYVRALAEKPVDMSSALTEGYVAEFVSFTRAILVVDSHQLFCFCFCFDLGTEEQLFCFDPGTEEQELIARTQRGDAHESLKFIKILVCGFHIIEHFREIGTSF